MKLILRQATVIDSISPYHHQKVDVKIIDGLIAEIAPEIDNDEGCQEVCIDQLHISQGWFDSSVSLGEPGYEDRETLSNGLTVAAKSGYTDIALQPNTYPILDNQSQISFVKAKANSMATSVYPIGALTKNSEGGDLAELYDMKNAGAVAFGDYNKNTTNANLLKIALQYVQDFDGLVIAFAQDEKIKGAGIVNEGPVATRLGLKGIPNMAEEIMVARNLSLLEYTGGKMHIPTISTMQSVQLIRQAKAKGLQVTCSVAVHHLVLTDEVLTTFDTRYKVCPPLRTEIDRQALLAAVLDGTIDCITSDHNPIDIEHKKLEFDLAKDGTIGLESAFGALLQVLPLDVVVAQLTAAKSIFNISSAPIAVGNVASISLFVTAEEWQFAEEHIRSKSKNSAFIKLPMKGKAVGICNNGQLVLS